MHKSTERRCAFCGGPIPRTRNTKALYCSEKCANKASWARQCDERKKIIVKKCDFPPHVDINIRIPAGMSLAAQIKFVAAQLKRKAEDMGKSITGPRDCETTIHCSRLLGFDPKKRIISYRIEETFHGKA